MPRYDYKCKKCGVIEIEHKMNEKVKICPKCGEKIEKLINSPSISFKGEGWTPKYHENK